MTDNIQGEETNLSDVNVPDPGPNPEFEVGISDAGIDEYKPPVLDNWDAINLMDIPDDCVNPEGVPIWDIVTDGTGLTKADIEGIQQRYVDNKGRPVPLFMVGISNFTFIVREVTTKLHRQIIQACHLDEKQYIEDHIVEGQKEEEVEISGNTRKKFEEINTIKVALVWPPIGSGDDQFDPDDEDLPFLVVSGLFTKILEASGAYDMPILKKV